MGRHAWEVEQSLYHTAGGGPLQHLTTLSEPLVLHAGPAQRGLGAADSAALHTCAAGRDRSARSMAAYPTQ